MNDVFSKDCLSGKSVLITGALGALGKVISESLVAHGAQVILSDLLSADQVSSESLPAGARYYQHDVTSEDATISLFNQVEVDCGSAPDIALCHAGICQDTPLEDYSLEEWEKIYAINTRGCFLTAREAVRRMKGKYSFEDPGKVIFTTSWVKQVPWPGLSGYNSSKAAVEQFMRTVAREYAGEHLRMNSISPGIVADGMALKAYQTDPSYKARADLAIPIGRLQPPESVAHAILFLCSSASNYMTGQSLVVDGGNSLYPMI